MSYGYVIDRLLIFDKPLTSTGGTICDKRNTISKIIILETDEKIIGYNGENCNFDRTYMVGKLSIKTSKRVLGPFGSSGKGFLSLKVAKIFLKCSKKKFRKFKNFINIETLISKVSRVYEAF